MVFFIIIVNNPYPTPQKARSMQDIGRKEFQKLRIEGKCMETYSKCEEKTVFNPIEKKLLQMCPPRVAQENFVSDISSATTIASGGEPCTGLSTAEASGVDPATTSNGLADGSCSLGESKSEKVDDLRGMVIKSFQLCVSWFDSLK